MKKNFAEPEMEVVRFNAQEIVTATSASIPICTSDCLNVGCTSQADVIWA